MPPTFIAVDLGGTNLRAARFEGNTPTPQRVEKTSTRSERGPEAVVDTVVEYIHIVAEGNLSQASIGVAVPGPLDPVRGVVLEAPNMPGWTAFPIKARLEEELDCPVAVGNDANLAALGEWQHGAGQGTQHMIYVTVSTGIGGGIINDGQLLIGARGLGGEIGHIVVDRDGQLCGCGQTGHLEAVASGPAITRRFRRRVDSGRTSSLADAAREGTLTAEQIGQAALDGDQLSRELIRETAQILGHHFTSLLHLFNPQVIVLGGGVSEIGDLLLDPLQASLENHVMHPGYLDGFELRRAELGDSAGLVGAMVLASQAT